MPRSFMYKRVNIFLLILMCLIVVGLAGSAIYFQESFKSLNSNYESVLTNFTTCQDVLAAKEERLLSCVEDLNSTAKDIGKYDVLYEDKVEQLQKTQTELDKTSRQLLQTKQELQQAEQEREAEQERALELQQQINVLNQRIDTLEAQRDACVDDLNECEDQLP